MIIENVTGVIQGIGNNVWQLRLDEAVGTESSGDPDALGDIVRLIIGFGLCMTSSPGIKGERRVSLEPPRDATGNAGGLDASV